MKLTYFSQQTLPKEAAGSKRLPKVSFAKSGVITFNKEAVKLLGLKPGDKVTLAQDPDEPINWYFFKDLQHGFDLRSAYKNLGVQFNHIELTRTFLDAIGKEIGVTHKFKIGGEPTIMKGDKSQTKYWGILVN
ncbi:MAG: hypothetical protein BGO55_00720 [Sphingobacteriales bacterium 50-39]|nr:AbrB/MazE/SpoVT family DNA-binding domain-containing protein [Sphingobacteriales bacterium]OJW53638.1 MAG: hypothetical protein BGO55_00720 [Sphingobacteriales bacterium 50-39]